MIHSTLTRFDSSFNSTRPVHVATLGLTYCRKMQANNHQTVSRLRIQASKLKSNNFSSPFTTLVFSKPLHTKNLSPLLVANGDPIAIETPEKTSEITEPPIPEPTQTTEPSPEPKRSKLTAREKLKAARIRSRNSDPKPVRKQELGSKVLEALRENDRITGKKRSGLPEAPTNMLDDSKRGMPPKGWTFELPVGWDVFLIILSVVVISTIMFTTTFVVWKMGAIHFNEY